MTALMNSIDILFTQMFQLFEIEGTYYVCAFDFLLQLSLHDTITKNLDKIKKPRTNNADSLY